ncbi:MAG: hypothetical protein HY699_20005 [Deltaproteobacteria bacterium]|nr:hypothetical protein [Deltaproteobacteria bacterium]
MPKKDDPSAAVKELLAAIANGTKKMGPDEFFWELQAQLKKYRPAAHADFAAWLRRAGIRKALTPEQCAVAAKMARKRENAVLAVYPPIERGY